MSRRHVKACPKEFRGQVVELALSSGRRPRETAEEGEISVDSGGAGAGRHSSKAVSARTA